MFVFAAKFAAGDKFGMLRRSAAEKALRVGVSCTCGRARRRQRAFAVSWRLLASRLHFSDGRGQFRGGLIDVQIAGDLVGYYETKWWARAKYGTTAEAQNCLSTARIPACEISWAS